MSSSADQTAYLLRAAQNGDDSALWRLTEQMRPYLKAVVGRSVGQGYRGKFDDSDVVQQSLARAVSRFGEFEGKTVEQWQAWLVAITSNEAKNSLRYWRQQRRDAQRELPQSPSAVGLPLADVQATPSQILMRRERAARLLALIETLEKSDQQLITWRHFDNLSHREIAERLGLQEATVRQRWRSVLQKLNRRWEQSE